MGGEDGRGCYSLDSVDTLGRSEGGKGKDKEGLLAWDEEDTVVVENRTCMADAWIFFLF